MPVVLDVRDLHAGYGRMAVVVGISLNVCAEELVGLIGRNGAGKTTTVRAIAGLRDGVFSGIVEVNGVPVQRLGSAKVVGCGLVLVPEGRRIFSSMTVSENLRLGSFSRRRQPARERERNLERVMALFPGLVPFLETRAGQLSGGQQQMVAVGRGLMAGPKVLILDEPTAGLAPNLSEELYRVMRQLADSGVGVLVVEQSIELALQHCDRAYVMDRGQIVRAGGVQELSKEHVTEAIMGRAASGGGAPEAPAPS